MMKVGCEKPRIQWRFWDCRIGNENRQGWNSELFASKAIAVLLFNSHYCNLTFLSKLRW
ncbi:MAG: hypothetical protein KME23_01885 [Goleter apudmare HA4340-LM2]|nr:hypothetical protein [Goleter apudmare HA4340-LM2]